MTPEEFRAARDKTGMSIKQTAEYLGKAYRTILSYQSGERIVPFTVAKLMIARVEGKL